jgi:hypothetical protein
MGIWSASSIPNGSRSRSARSPGTATRPADRGVGRCGPGQHFSSGSQLGQAGAPGDSLDHFVGV